jgi:hypothetical protein
MEQRRRLRSCGFLLGLEPGNAFHDLSLVHVVRLQL